MLPAETLLFLGGLLLLGHVLAFLFRKTLIPDVLWITLIGLLLGPQFLDKLSPEYFGSMGNVISVLAIIVILFEGGLHLDLEALGKSLGSVLVLALGTFAFSMVLAFLIVYPHVEDASLAAIAGAILSATSAAVVVPLSNSLPISQKTKGILLVESALIDVLAIVLTVGILKSMNEEGPVIGLISQKILISLIAAAILGALGGYLWSYLIPRIRKQSGSLTLTLAFLLLLIGAAEVFHWAGAVAAMTFGFVLINRPFIKKDESENKLGKVGHAKSAINYLENGVLEEIIFLLKLFFFLYLGTQLKLGNMGIMGWAILLSAAVYVFRFFLTKITMARKIPTFDSGIVALMIPKGLATAVLATQVHNRFPEKGQFIVDFAFEVVFVTLVSSSVLVPMMKSDTAKTFIQFFFKGSDEDEGTETIIVKDDKAVVTSKEPGSENDI